MNNKKYFITGAIIILALFIVKSLLSSSSKYGQVKSISKSISTLKSDNALSKIRLKENTNIDNTFKAQEGSNEMGINQEIELTHDEVIEKERRISEIYKMDQKKMHLYLKEIKKNQQSIVKWKRDNGLRVSALESTSPEFAITLSTILNRPIEEAVEVERSDLRFSSQDWYFIKTFASSGDLEKLMKQGKLNEENVNIKTLSMVYSNNPQIVYRKNGQVDGLPKAEENLEDSIDRDDPMID